MRSCCLATRTRVRDSDPTHCATTSDVPSGSRRSNSPGLSPPLVPPSRAADMAACVTRPYRALCRAAFTPRRLAPCSTPDVVRQPLLRCRPSAERSTVRTLVIVRGVMAVRVLVSGGGIAGLAAADCSDAARDRGRPRRAGHELADQRCRDHVESRTASGRSVRSGSTEPWSTPASGSRPCGSWTPRGSVLGEFPVRTVARCRRRHRHPPRRAAAGAGRGRVRRAPHAGDDRAAGSTTVGRRRR